MPTYEYKCDACGYEFEKFQSIMADPIKKCPKCGKNKVKRLLGVGAGVIFKGSGFYITDYRSESYKDAAKSDAPASGEGSGGDKKTETASPAAATEKSDSKPAAESKPEPKSENKAATSSAKAASKPAAASKPKKSEKG